MGDDLEARLKSHAQAFAGLMSLIPAKDYYGKDESITSTQWQQKKKQTTEQRQAAKRAKLDPASHKTAKDVMDENALKRKRELEGEGGLSGEESSDLDMYIEKEKPLEGIKIKTKKQKTEDAAADTAGDNDDVKRSKAQALKEAKAEKKKEKKKDKQAQKKKQLETKKARQSDSGKVGADTKAPKGDEMDEEDENEDDDELDNAEDRVEDLDVSGLIEEVQSTDPSTAENSNTSPSVVSADSSSSSTVPPPGEEAPEKKEKKPFVFDQQSHDNFRARLNAKLEAMRASRKADGPDGRPARNRAELIETRRKKEAERKAAKKTSRQEAKEDEARQKAEEQLARIRGGSGSPSIFPARSPETERSFNFGKVAWEDGQQLQGSLSGFLENRKKKGKSDAKTALEAAQKKHARISGLDETKRKDIEEKDLWLNAKKRAQGEKVHDDVGLLKKSLKRQLKQKEKSKQEWKDRLTNVEQGKEKQQKRREENLRKRKEDKGQKGKKKSKKPAKKVKKRPGFEGTFKAR
ncbi:SURF6-domain-containing protein [Dothidotthia symphoricarpi CBS 119687]|uniref:SURF6-domain-containing protein n=1 Tax=Dothidotthia symphoricarpi CBS 119687 TaxID=1392245 RepID=A0A6A6AUL0_9PLEO|nr:SURF6-domain-containing protein [Dothidotthia symphoricarpi CBS 119687]KAF2134655.1 SURF6-domain-containing protein [Dothidotthia symphoricarpi CBS 119687]